MAARLWRLWRGAIGTQASISAIAAASIRTGSVRFGPPCTTRCPAAENRATGNPRSSQEPRMRPIAASWSGASQARSIASSFNLAAPPISLTLRVNRGVSSAPKTATLTEEEPALTTKIAASVMSRHRLQKAQQGKPREQEDCEAAEARRLRLEEVPPAEPEAKDHQGRCEEDRAPGVRPDHPRVRHDRHGPDVHKREIGDERRPEHRRRHGLRGEEDGDGQAADARTVGKAREKAGARMAGRTHPTPQAPPGPEAGAHQQDEARDGGAGQVGADSEQDGDAERHPGQRAEREEGHPSPVDPRPYLRHLLNRHQDIADDDD